MCFTASGSQHLKQVGGSSPRSKRERAIGDCLLLPSPTELSHLYGSRIVGNLAPVSYTHLTLPTIYSV